jgi:hypothetical protein
MVDGGGPSVLDGGWWMEEVLRFAMCCVRGEIGMTSLREESEERSNDDYLCRVVVIGGMDLPPDLGPGESRQVGLAGPLLRTP